MLFTANHESGPFAANSVLWFRHNLARSRVCLAPSRPGCDDKSAGFYGGLILTSAFRLSAFASQFRIHARIQLTVLGRSMRSAPG